MTTKRSGAEDERLAVYEREREELAAVIIKAVNGQYIGKPPPLLTGWQERAVSAVLAAGWLPPAAVQERVDAVSRQGITAEQVAYIKAATLQEEANWWEQVRPTTVGRTQFGTWLRGRADVHLRAAGVPVQDGDRHG